jgi:hypothetical protein
LALALATCAGAAPDKDVDKEELIKKDLETMQGKWVLVSEKVLSKQPVSIVGVKKGTQWIIRDGIWVLTGLNTPEQTGWEIREEKIDLSQAGAHLIIKDNRYCRYYQYLFPQDNQIALKLACDLTLDPTKKPKTFDGRANASNFLWLLMAA